MEGIPLKPHFKLHLVTPAERPLGPLSRAEKLANAKAYLQRRGLYILDRGTPKPKWGLAGEPPRAAYKDGYRSLPNFLERMHEGIRALWRGQ